MNSGFSRANPAARQTEETQEIPTHPTLMPSTAHIIDQRKVFQHDDWQAIDKNPPQEKKTHRLWSSQRFVLSLLALDLIVALFTILGIIIGSRDSSLLTVTELALCVIAWFICSAILGGLSSRREESTSRSVSFRAGFTTLALCIVASALPGLVSHPAQLFIMVGALTAGSVIGRSIFRRYSSPVVLVVGGDAEEAPVAAGVQARRLEVTPELRADSAALIAKIRETARSYDACSVELNGQLGLSADQLQGLSWELREQQASLRFAIAGGPLRASRVHAVMSGDHAVLEISAPQQPWAVRAAKRTFDIVGSALLLLLFSPLLLILAVLVKVTSKGPVFYRQERIGRHGRPFKMWKFRSMVDNADAQLHALLAQQSKGDQPLFKVDNDPRITRFGAVMRRYSLDELPQLFNVLGGTMSLVGPRPQRPSEVALYSGGAVHRLGVLPGMTGLWQVSGRSRLTWEAAQRLDIDYAHNWSLGKDLWILTRTARAVLGADGAQ
ncbi:exopolysaccharide biosynthesis polyprenyl glycosylphosphotransferase [Saxibacter everestensis]|uniref:Exopolysaccharide biosynthesis polyprenyl glycosylphosphotransferase n=1 Tax=Saxibacter everestensis TaxID=2909229 RepID=A0ABY8QTS5_9MICO|nr:exopolysaccharide biosynthesis polyprenyl glycosylphosphotransferase [Brevibacteriaceae bacterium ZFBP1038]